MRHPNNPRGPWFAALLIALFCAGPAAATATHDDAAAHLTALLDDLDTVQSRFEQITMNAENRIIQENNGRLWVQSPNQFRVETTSPFAQTLVSDGEDFWSFDKDLAQVVIRTLDQDFAEVPVLLLGGRSSDVVDTYDVTLYESEEGTHFVLTPKDSGAVFETMTLTMREARPRRIEISDSLGQRTRIDFSDVVVGEPIDADQFTLEIPADVDVIDDRHPAS